MLPYVGAYHHHRRRRCLLSDYTWLVLTAWLWVSQQGACTKQNTDCEQHSILYPRIQKDLARFKGGITEAHWDTIFKPGCKPNSACHHITLLILNGTVYLTTLPERHVGSLDVNELYAGYFLEIYETALRYKLPDVEFAITHQDDPPDTQAGTHSLQDAPVILSFARSDDMTSILMPFSPHFRCLFNPLDEVVKNLQVIDYYQWASKKEIALGRYSDFCAYWHDNAVFLDGHATPCARTHLAQLSARHADVLDCKTVTGGVHYMPFHEQAAYKYVVSTDGWTASSKLARYLLLNSTVLKQHSPKYEYYYDALEPMTHYVPFYVNHADDILEQEYASQIPCIPDVEYVVRSTVQMLKIEFLRTNDGEAQRIAAAGRQFAMKHLQRSARLCYWRQLLTEIAKLQRFKPSCSKRRICVPLQKELSYLGHFTACKVHEQMDEMHGEKLDHGEKIGQNWADVIYVHDTPL